METQLLADKNTLLLWAENELAELYSVLKMCVMV